MDDEILAKRAYLQKKPPNLIGGLKWFVFDGGVTVSMIHRRI